MTMKWSHNIAQGFRPGYDAPTIALQGRPMGSARGLATTLVRTVARCVRPSVALTARGIRSRFPRAKALGYVLKPLRGIALETFVTVIQTFVIFVPLVKSYGTIRI